MHGCEHMPRYAVEIGKVILRSDKPITMEERRAAIRQLLDNPELAYTEEGLEVDTVLSKL